MFKKRLINFLLIVLGILIFYLLLLVFNLSGAEINWIFILCAIVVALIGIYIFTKLKIINAINLFFVGIWLLVTPFKFSFTDNSIFYTVIFFLPIGLSVFIFGIKEIMKDIE